jgi:hypothetical protein
MGGSFGATGNFDGFLARLQRVFEMINKGD